MQVATAAIVPVLPTVLVLRTELLQPKHCVTLAWLWMFVCCTGLPAQLSVSTSLEPFDLSLSWLLAWA
jgi:hypothetical protein